MVVGAGIAGLTAAYRLSRSGFDVTVLEAEPDVGGRLSTLAKDGYRFDLAASPVCARGSVPPPKRSGLTRGRAGRRGPPVAPSPTTATGRSARRRPR